MSGRSERGVVVRNVGDEIDEVMSRSQQIRDRLRARRERLLSAYNEEDKSMSRTLTKLPATLSKKAALKKVKAKQVPPHLRPESLAALEREVLLAAARSTPDIELDTPTESLLAPASGPPPSGYDISVGEMPSVSGDATGLSSAFAVATDAGYGSAIKPEGDDDLSSPEESYSASFTHFPTISEEDHSRRSSARSSARGAAPAPQPPRQVKAGPATDSVAPPGVPPQTHSATNPSSATKPRSASVREQDEAELGGLEGAERLAKAREIARRRAAERMVARRGVHAEVDIHASGKKAGVVVPTSMEPIDEKQPDHTTLRLMHEERMSEKHSSRELLFDLMETMRIMGERFDRKIGDTKSWRVRQRLQLQRDRHEKAGDKHIKSLFNEYLPSRMPPPGDPFAALPSPAVRGTTVAAELPPDPKSGAAAIAQLSSMDTSHFMEHVTNLPISDVEDPGPEEDDPMAELPPDVTMNEDALLERDYDEGYGESTMRTRHAGDEEDDYDEEDTQPRGTRYRARGRGAGRGRGRGRGRGKSSRKTHKQPPRRRNPKSSVLGSQPAEVLASALPRELLESGTTLVEHLPDDRRTKQPKGKSDRVPTEDMSMREVLQANTLAVDYHFPNVDIYDRNEKVSGRYRQPGLQRPSEKMNPANLYPGRPEGVPIKRNAGKEGSKHGEDPLGESFASYESDEGEYSANFHEASIILEKNTEGDSSAPSAPVDAPSAPVDAPSAPVDAPSAPADALADAPADAPAGVPADADVTPRDPSSSQVESEETRASESAKPSTSTPAGLATTETKTSSEATPASATAPDSAAPNGPESVTAPSPASTGARSHTSPVPPPAPSAPTEAVESGSGSSATDPHTAQPIAHGGKDKDDEGPEPDERSGTASPGAPQSGTGTQSTIGGDPADTSGPTPGSEPTSAAPSAETGPVGVETAALVSASSDTPPTEGPSGGTEPGSSHNGGGNSAPEHSLAAGSKGAVAEVGKPAQPSSGQTELESSVGVDSNPTGSDALDKGTVEAESKNGESESKDGAESTIQGVLHSAGVAESKSEEAAGSKSDEAAESKSNEAAGSTSDEAAESKSDEATESKSDEATESKSDEATESKSKEATESKTEEAETSTREEPKEVPVADDTEGNDA